MVPYLLVAADVPDISHVGGFDTDKGHDAAVCIDDDVLSLASLTQSLPNPRGGSMACRSPMSKSQMACSASAVALCCRLSGKDCSQASHSFCSAANSATASRQRWARLRRLTGRRVPALGVADLVVARSFG